MHDKVNIESLLYEEESSTLDFKQEMYKFSGATDYQKSEIIKDILAFANGWRRDTAYILIGVAEVQAGRSNPIGIKDDIDDAALQQLVNSKTHRPVEFSYSTHLIDGVKIGLIEIPIQNRPNYLNKPYGILKIKHEVVMRRGSGTVTATPDDIVAMAKSDLKLTKEVIDISFDFATRESEDIIGKKVELTPSVIDVSRLDEIGDFVEEDIPMKMPESLDGISIVYTKEPIPDYYRNLAIFEYEVSRTRNLSFAITNKSAISLRDVRVQIIIDDLAPNNCLRMQDSMPDKPERYTDPISNMKYPTTPPMVSTHNNDGMIELDQIKNQYRLNVKFNKIQPKQTIYCENDILISAVTDFETKLKVVIYADEISEPINKELIVCCRVNNKEQRLIGAGQKVTHGLVLKDFNLIK